MEDDHTLLRRYVDEQSQEAFTAVVQRYLPLVYSAALRRTNGDVHAAADVSQTVFISLAKHARTLPRDTVLAGWLYVAARNATLNLLRAERRRRVHEQRAQTMNEDFENETSPPDWKSLRPVIDGAIDELPAKDRDAVLLRFFGQRSHASVASSLGLSEDAARMRVDRALEKLRTLLQRHGITSTTSALGLLLNQQAVAAVPAGLSGLITTAALVSATSGTASFVSFLAFMNTTKALGVIAVVALLALGGAVYEANQAHAARTALDAANLERSRFAQNVTALETRVRAAESKIATASIPPPPAAPPAPEKNTAPAISSGALRPGNPLGSLYALRGNPEAMEAWLKAARSGLDLQLGPLVTSLNLSPAQAVRLKEITLERFQSLADILGAAQARGLSMSDAEVKATYQGTVDKAETELHALLGDAGYQRLKQFGATAGIREITRSLASDLYHSSAPLSAQQGEQLIQLVADHSTPTSSSYNPSSANWEAIFAEAPQFLTETQIAALRAERDQMILREQLDHIGKSMQRPSH